jgi:two-component system, LytTR family, response regulator
MIRVIAIEDDRQGMEHLLRLIQNNLPDIEVVGTGRTNADLIRMIEQEDLEPDVLVLDIQLPDGQVFQSLNMIDISDLQIIFTTAYNEYAVTAFEKAAIHYLLKPISKESLISAFQRVKRPISPTEPEPDNMTVRVEMARKAIELGPNAVEKTGIASVNGVRFVNFRDIVRLEGDDNYTTFFLLDGERIIASRNIGYYHEHYEKHNFIQVHQSNIINYNHLERYVRGEGGHVILSNGETVSVSRRWRTHFLERMRILSDYVT